MNDSGTHLFSSELICVTNQRKLWFSQWFTQDQNHILPYYSWRKTVCDKSRSEFTLKDQDVLLAWFWSSLCIWWTLYYPM